MKVSVHLIGPYPPPYGGVSTHVSRLRNRLLQDGHGCIVWSSHHNPESQLKRLPSSRVAVRALAAEQNAIFHFHGKHYLAGQMVKQGCKVMFTVHNERINEDLGHDKTLRGWWQNKRTRASFLQVPQLLAVSDRARDELLSFGFPATRINVIPAYLRPDDSELVAPQNLIAFKTFRKRHNILLTACAWAIKRHHGEDLYGVDLCIEMIGRIATRHPEVGLVLALPGSNGTQELVKLQQRVEQLGIGQQVLFLLEPGAYHPVLMQCDLFLRPTNTDGFSISIAEAFEYSVPVIASDAVPRPDGCILFDSRNLTSFTNQVCATLENLEIVRAACTRHRVKDRYEEIFGFYQSLAAQPFHNLKADLRLDRAGTE